MASPRIPATDPVVVPAEEEKTYPDLFVSGLRVQYLPGAVQQMWVSAHPYNHDTDEVLPSGEVAGYRTQHLASEMQRVPALREALIEMRRVCGLLLWEKRLGVRITELHHQIEVLEARIATASPVEIPALEAQKAALESQRTDVDSELATVRTYLGIAH